MIQPGDRVAYSHDFLRSIGMIHDREMGHAFGIVEAVQHVGPLRLACIKWERREDMPAKVNITNLRRVGCRAVAYARVSAEHQLVGAESQHYCVLCDRSPCICEIGGEA
jgi:hypothetical protein